MFSKSVCPTVAVGLGLNFKATEIFNFYSATSILRLQRGQKGQPRTKTHFILFLQNSEKLTCDLASRRKFEKGIGNDA